MLLGIDLDHNRGLKYCPIILFIIMALFIFIFSLKNRRLYKLKEVNITDSYTSENN